MVGRRMSAARMRGDRAHLGCTHMFVYSSPSVWIARKKRIFGINDRAVWGIDCEGGRGERLTASCREGMIDEPNGELDLLVKARQPTCSCNARSARRLYIYVCEKNVQGRFRGKGLVTHRTTNARCSRSALSVKTRELGPSGARELAQSSRPIRRFIPFHEKNEWALGKRL